MRNPQGSPTGDTGRYHGDTDHRDSEPMKLSDAIKAFDTQSAIADLLGIRPQQISKWRAGNTVPERHRARLVVESAGRLRASPDDIDRWREEIKFLRRALALGAKKP